MGLSKFRWRWAPSVTPAEAGALRAAMKREALVPVTGIRVRRLTTRGFWTLPMADEIGCDVFAKEYKELSFTRRLRGLVRRSPADREFDNLVRLAQVGVGVPRPLAKVDDGFGLSCRASFVLMEHLAGWRPVAEHFRLYDEGVAEGREGFFSDLAEFILGMFSRGVVHKNLFPYNIMVHCSEAGTRRFAVIDVSAADFLPRVPREAAQGDVTFLAGFLLYEGGSHSLIEGFLETLCRLDGQEHMGIDPRGLLADAEGKAKHFRRRAERKNRERAGRSEESGAEVFAT
ncbi:MAG: lipopolysaccharide kinase InaA family protein, partial [Planctomycetia bacterium]|nr:lipopolysaccharide kinase InaA family protein [Planctomycetia bacterium]